MGTITLPNNPGTIQNAQVTDATKVMENFTAIVSEVNGNIEPVNIKALAVETAKIAALAVTAAKLATDAVETLKIKDANVTVAKLAADSVETPKIKNLNVTAGKLAADAVETAKIKNLNVTVGKLAADAVETAKIKDENVTLAKIAQGTLDTYLKAQGAAAPIYEKLALKDTGIKFGQGNKNSSGVSIVTGVGFQPSVVILLSHGNVGVNAEFSIGFDDGTNHISIFHTYTGFVAYTANYSLFFSTGATPDNMSGTITALDADGFTITWVKNGTPPTVSYVYLALP